MATNNKTKPILAKRIESNEHNLVIITDKMRYEIPWERCSTRLARASALERGLANLSPSGYGIHWPLIDEDLAVGPLVRLVDPQAG